MIDKTVFDNAIGQLQQIANRYGIDTIKESCQRIVDVRDSFEMKVLFIGHFSSGKSSLINELIGKGEYLKEGQNPTTAQIRELHASDPDMSNLRPLSDYTIVDTPGFDSPNSDHARALSMYLGEGGGYIVVVDVTKGELDPTTLRYVDEVSGYTDNLSVVLNHCDKIGKTSRENVLAKVRGTLESHGHTIPVHCLSRYDSDVRERLIAIIQSFSIDHFFHRRMQMAFHAERGSILTALRLALRHADRGTWRYDVQLGNLNNAKEQIKAAFKREMASAEEAFPQKVDVVTAAVQTALESRADVCAELILAQDSEALEATMLSAVRPVILRHVREIASKQVDSIVHGLNFSGVMEGCSQKDISECVIDTLTATRELIDSGTLGQALSVFEKEREDAKSKHDETNRMYKAVTGITALLTDVINPWAEVVIVLLPEIVNVCKALFGASEQEIARDRYLKRVTSVVIAKLYVPIEMALRNATEALIHGLEQECSKRLNAIEAEISELEDVRGKSVVEDDNRRMALEQDVKMISEMKHLEIAR